MDRVIYQDSVFTVWKEVEDYGDNRKNWFNVYQDDKYVGNIDFTPYFQEPSEEHIKAWIDGFKNAQRYYKK